MAFLPGPAIQYFGRFPTEIIMKSTSSFDGTPQLNLPTLSPGQYTFPAQAGGGQYWFHTEPIEVSQILYGGAGTLTVKKVLTAPSTTITRQSTQYGISGVSTVNQTLSTTTNTILSQTTVATLTAAAPLFSGCIPLSPNEYLVMTSSGDSAPTLAVTANQAEYKADGGS